MNNYRDMKKIIANFFILILLIFFTSACVHEYVKPESKTGYYYVTRQDDTLASIARDHRMTVEELAEVNDLDKSVTIKKGMVLFVPREMPTKKTVQEKLKEEPLSQKQKTEPYAEKASSKTGTILKPDTKKSTRTTSPQENVKMKQGDGSKPITASKDTEGIQKGKFIWPLKGKVISKYGPQANGMFYNGIRIEVVKESAVTAAAGGQVIFSALLKDYGETVIIKHDQNYATVYTHLSKRVVRVDQKIKRGEKIATVIPAAYGVGFIDFEIRYKNKAKDPLLFLS